MRLLLIDTCGTAGSVALAEGELIMASEMLPGRSASERLVPVVRQLLEGQGWRLAELAAIVVVHGPGSFTGVRVGLSAAKGLSEASGVGLVAISRLAVLAKGGRAALDAGRGEFYFGDYTDGHAEEALVGLAELPCGVRVCETLAGVIDFEMVPQTVAGDALALALERVRAGRFDDAAAVDANYLRRMYAGPTG